MCSPIYIRSHKGSFVRCHCNIEPSCLIIGNIICFTETIADKNLTNFIAKNGTQNNIYVLYWICSFLIEFSYICGTADRAIKINRNLSWSRRKFTIVEKPKLFKLIEWDKIKYLPLDILFSFFFFFLSFESIYFSSVE